MNSTNSVPENGQPITSEHKVIEGSAVQITLPSGKYIYTGIDSVFESKAKRLNLDCKIVQYCGCHVFQISKKAHEGFSIKIDGKSVVDFIEKIATDEENNDFLFQS